MDLPGWDTARLEGLSQDELVDELGEWAGHLSAGLCRMLALVAELDRRECWALWGFSSLAGWLSWHCALSGRAAREHVRVARALGGLPLTQAAFSRGELSYAKVRAVTRVATAESEEGLLELAAVLTASQLERTLSVYRRVSTEEARELQAREHVSWLWDDDGSLVLRGRLAPEDGAVLVQALQSVRERLRREAWEEARGSAEPRGDGQPVCGSAEPRPEGGRVGNVDALVAVAGAALAHEDVRTGADRYQVVVHVDETTLTHDEGASVLAEGPPLAAETARRLACDASLVTLVSRDGEPVGVGRKTRKVSPALRRALEARDGGCRFPGCQSRRGVDAHHIEHWAHGGETELANLVLLCRRHHRLVHEGGYSVDRELCFYDPLGCMVPVAPGLPGGSAAALLQVNWPLGITPRTCWCGTGERLDLDLAVAAVVGVVRSSKRPREKPIWRLYGVSVRWHVPSRDGRTSGIAACDGREYWFEAEPDDAPDRPTSRRRYFVYPLGDAELAAERRRYEQRHELCGPRGGSGDDGCVSRPSYASRRPIGWFVVPG